MRGSGSSVGIATGWTVRDRISVGARLSTPVQTGPAAHPVSCTMDSGSSSGVKSGRGVTLTTHPLLVPWSRKSRATALLPLWAVCPVQNLSALQGYIYYEYVLSLKMAFIAEMCC